MISIALFNHKGGVGKTSLAYHLAYLFAENGRSVLAVDLDPQSNLSSMFVPDDRIDVLWRENKTIPAAIQPLMEGTGDVVTPHVEEIAPRLGLVVGDLRLSQVEDELSLQWSLCVDGKVRAFRVVSAFWRAIEKAAQSMSADLVFIDVGPNLGAINRSALIVASHVLIPLGPDLFSLRGLESLGPTLRDWRHQWADRLGRIPNQMNLSLPAGRMQPIGYVVLQHGVRDDRPVKAYQRWIERIPAIYRESVLGQTTEVGAEVSTSNDPYCLSLLKHYRSLMTMAMEARLPMYQLKPAHGAIGSHVAAVRDCRRDFELLAARIDLAIHNDF